MHGAYIVRHGGNLMPFFHEVAAFLWGGADYDSDGDARSPVDREWSELDISRRDRSQRAVAITPRDSGQRESLVEADELDDAKGAAYLLAHRTDGQVFDAEVAEVDIDVLAGEIGDLEARLARADVVQERFLSHDFRP